MNLKDKKFHNLFLRLLFYFFISSLVLSLSKDFFISPVHAADFRTSYNIEYFIQENDPQGYTKTAYTIRITNLQPDLIIKKYTLSFPKSFTIGALTAKDAYGPIRVTTVEKERSIETTFELSKPTPGLNEENVLYLDFLQKNIFRTKGSIWELLIPTLENNPNNTSTITVYLPAGKNRKLSLSKPIPSSVSFDKVVWNEQTGKSIYAVFGEEQRYTLDLMYHLVNPNIYSVYTDIALPPDTAYQKIVVDSLIPPPETVFSDTDGNYMARYTLKSKEERQVQFKGIAHIYTKPRSEYKPYESLRFAESSRTLFDSQPLWKLDNETPVKSNEIKDHYDYTVKTLSYNFNRIIQGNSRMGASQAIKFPDQAVCTEYSDLLIASSRQRGIYIREVQGYAFANEQELRPIQSESDILHSWVEYYDVKKNTWIPIDPTWEDTSAIDYFNSFDFNHIVFALHGKKADYPYPAGSYKSSPRVQDIKISPTTDIIPERKKVSVSVSNLPIPDVKQSFIVDVLVKNEGNSVRWNIPIDIKIEGATLATAAYKIDHLLPFEIKKIPLRFTPNNSLFYATVVFDISIDGQNVVTNSIQVPTIIFSLKRYFMPLVAVIGGVGILLLLLNKKK